MALTMTELMKQETMTEAQIFNLMEGMTEAEAMKFLEEPEVKYPMSETEILSQTGWMGGLVMEFIKQSYPEHYSRMMIEEEMLPFVQKRVDEAKELMREIEDNYLMNHKVEEEMDFLATVKLRNQARQVATEIIQKEVLFRPLVLTF